MVSGEVEVDETFIGGAARFMHAEKRRVRITETGTKDKTPVMGILERGGKVRAGVIPNRREKAIQKEIRNHVAAGSAIYFPPHPSFQGVHEEFVHQGNHHAEEYFDCPFRNNRLEKL